MRKIIFIFTLLSMLTVCEVSAQNVIEISVADTSNAFFTPLIDSTLVGRNMMDIISSGGKGDITINQSSDISNAYEKHIRTNSERKISGYRVRIYFDNNQNARQESQKVAREFAAEHPSVRVYQSHVSPYFKVTVGDFRTKADAQQFAKSISGRYPSVFLVKENINYPEI